MHAAVLAALVVSGVAGLGTMANEATHGGVSEMMGMGHHHMTDMGGYHCASHVGEHGSQHMDHMHDETHMAHDNCPGGSDMHDMDNPMMPGGMMNG
jgi:hypothetical protein